MLKESLLTSVLIVAIVAITYANPPKIDDNHASLEIYTQEDIIYIKGLTVSFETKEDVLHFKSKLQLKEYISTITAKQIKP